jgi:beta-glucosidase
MIQTYPPGFVWGAASSSFQIEGASRVDGRGPSIWDTFCLTPGRIADHSDGTVACDHYHLWEKDLDLMRDLGVSAYRFSIAWPRIYPEGRGKVQTKGLDFYNRLVDGMLARGIAPWVTLYHWDLPQSLQNYGGWTSRSTAEAFADYAATVVKSLGDRVQHWITLNEPFCSAVLGHRTGEHAPGFTDGGLALRAAHHLLLGHGLALSRMRELAPKAQHGITLNLTPTYIDQDTPEAQRDARFTDGDLNRWYLDSLFKGFYPEDMKRAYEQRGFIDVQRPSAEGFPGASERGWSFIKENDLRIISQPIDFLGVNFYTHCVIGRSRSPEQERLLRKDGNQYTAMGWEIAPQALEDLLVRLHSDYPCPSYYITENGAAFDDHVEADGRIHDHHRVEYYRRHLEKVSDICHRGIPLKGYFAWSTRTKDEGPRIVTIFIKKLSLKKLLGPKKNNFIITS